MSPPGTHCGKLEPSVCGGGRGRDRDEHLRGGPSTGNENRRTRLGSGRFTTTLPWCDEPSSADGKRGDPLQSVEGRSVNLENSMFLIFTGDQGVRFHGVIHDEEFSPRDG